MANKLITKDSPHEHLYKQTFSKTETPQWKVKFQEKCLNKIRQQKANIINNFRFGKEMGKWIENELNEFKGESLYWNPENEIFVSENEMIDIMTYLEEQIRNEQLEQESLILKQYEEAKDFDERALQSKIDEYLQESQTSSFSSPNSFQATCFKCKQNRLFQNKGVIFCSCGFRLDCKGEIDLVYFASRLEEQLTNHNLHCLEAPQIEVKNNFGVQATYFTCDKCGYFQVVA